MDDELLEMVKNFVKMCEEKHCHGIAAILTEDNKKTHTGISANYLKAVFLLRAILQKLQELTGKSSTLVATHLALSMAILDMDANKNEPIEKIDSITLEKAAKVVRQYIDIQLAQTRLEEARMVNFTSPFLQ